MAATPTNTETACGTHVADPTDGDSARIGEVLAGDNPVLVERLLADDDHDEFLTPAQRIAAAAEARVLLEELLLQHRGRLDESDRGWPIGSGGPVRYAQQQHRFLRAMLPSCAGLSIDAEMTRLAEEATLSYAGLGESTRRDHAEALLATIKRGA